MAAMAEPPTPLDETDLAVVLALQVDPRATAVQLAAAVGCTPASAGARLRRLLDERVVEVLGHIDPRSVGPATMALAMFRSLRPASVVEDLAGLEGVQLAMEVFGEWEGMCTLVAADQAQLDALVDSALRSRPDVDAVEVHGLLSTTVAGVPEVEPVALRDDVDRAVALCLVRDARASYAAIAAQTGLKEATARLRAVRLLDGGAVLPLVIPDAAVFGLDVIAGLAIRVDASPGPVAEAVAGLPGVLLVNRLLGPAAVGAEVLLPGLAELSQLRSHIRSLPGVTGVEVHIFARPRLGRCPLPPR
jgi:DNA-binding Lrp family transcriptional regulator